MEIGKYWKTIVDTLHDGLMVLDPEGNILAMNPAAEELTGYSADELVGQNCRTLNAPVVNFMAGVPEKSGAACM